MIWDSEAGSINSAKRIRSDAISALVREHSNLEMDPDFKRREARVTKVSGGRSGRITVRTGQIQDYSRSKTDGGQDLRRGIELLCSINIHTDLREGLVILGRKVERTTQMIEMVSGTSRCGTAAGSRTP